MDVARPPRKKTGRNLAIAGGVLAVIVVFYLTSRLKPAAPTVDMAVTIVDSVRRGDMTIEVRGPGTLVPEQIVFIPAQTSARVDQLVVQSGQVVKAGDVLLDMSSPDAEIAALQADQSLSQARAALLTLRSTLKNDALSQEGTVASTNTLYVTAMQNEAAADTLAQHHLNSAFDVAAAHASAAELVTRLANEKERLQVMRQSADSQIVAAATNVAQLKDIADFYHQRQQSLVVRAPVAGVIEGLILEPGQYALEGSTLLKIVQPGKLKAQLQIPEAQAKDVNLGQPATIDTRSNGLIPGHVSRKDPSAVGGTVTIDVALDGPLPPGAVPDLSVDGTIQIEKLHDVLYTGRPGGASTGPVGLFKLVDNGHAAERVQVLLGRSSVTSVEVVKGLHEGDKVILSDMSQYDGVDRVRLKQ